MDKDKQAIIFSNEELNELLVVLNVALEDANTASHRSHDMQEVDAYKQHKKSIRKWIHRFSQLISRQGRGKEAQKKA